MDIVSKNHINDEVKNKFNITIEMHRKQRGKNIFMVYSSILVRKFCLRVWEVCDGKGEINEPVDFAWDILPGIFQKEQNKEF